jgi:hypothetical protein
MKAKDLRRGQKFRLFHDMNAGVFVRISEEHDSADEVAALQYRKGHSAYFRISKDTEVLCLIYPIPHSMRRFH